jgi:hypothetical protein
MATKAELEDAHTRYGRLCAEVAREEAGHASESALAQARTGWQLVFPALAFARRWVKPSALTAPTVDCVLRLAPPLFRGDALDELERWFATGTRTERNSLPDLLAQLASARDALARAVELWRALSVAPGATVRPTDARDSALARVWLSVGAVAAGPNGLRRVSDPRQPARGKCFECGTQLAVPLVKLLESYPCPKCRAPRAFALVGRTS